MLRDELLDVVDEAKGLSLGVLEPVAARLCLPKGPILLKKIYST